MMKARKATTITPSTMQISIFPTLNKKITVHVDITSIDQFQFIKIWQFVVCIQFYSPLTLFQLQTHIIIKTQALISFKKVFHILANISLIIMGLTNSNSIDQQNKVLHQHLSRMGVKDYSSYRFVQKKDDCAVILQNIQNQTYYLLRTLTVTAEEDALSLARILQKRNKIACVHLCKIIAIHKQQEALACSQIHKVHILIECPLKSLRNMFSEKIHKIDTPLGKQYFHESQLWGIIYSLVKALKSLYLYGIIHQSLSLECIYIDEKGLIKLADPALFGLEKNYITAMKEKENCQAILSPEILVFLDEFNFYFYEKEKSDVFILGILLIQLAGLKEFPVYDYKQKIQRFQLIDINLSQIKNRYSSKLYSVLQWMTAIEPKKRPRLSQLLDFIDKNNSSDKSTSITNTVIEARTQTPTLVINRNMQRNKTVSVFTVDSKPVSHNFHEMSRSESKIHYSPQLPQIKQSTAKKEPIRERTPTEQSKDVFPFELIYNRVINNNDNMKRFEIEELCKQYKINDMFASSCRGSVPSSSYHARIEQSGKQMANKQLKLHDALAYSKNSVSKAPDYLVYSQSSAFAGSNKLSFSKNSLGDIKLVQSNHFRQGDEIKRPTKVDYFATSNIIEDANEQTSISSPYRKLTSHKNSQGVSLTSIKYMDMEPTPNKQVEEMKHSDILQKYMDENKPYNPLNDPGVYLESRYFSQQQEKQPAMIVAQNNLQSFQSQYLKGEGGSSRHMPDKKIGDSKLQEKYDKYLLSDKILNKQTDKYLSSRNITFQSSELQSKISRTTPNFAQKSQRQNSSQKQQPFFKDYQFLQESDLMFVQNQINQEGSIYTGYKSKAGLKQRHGKLEFHDGGYYEGQWKNDMMQGYGQLYYGNGALAYKGLWLEGCFSGNGQIFNDKPQKFSEPFDYRNFTSIEDKWLSYQGEFQNDSKHGKGKINLTNGEYFEGAFDYDMIQGYGAFHAMNGQVIKGLWKDNELIEYE